MRVTIITPRRAPLGRRDVLGEGRNRVRAADECESFEPLQDDQDPRALVFQQR